ncbi:MAG: 16S rRNA (cytidine(1402)-2'-O)-methyltransferase [Clostridia bacterium]|nr:16S rRNA (cytidine(1402)-2'-O)-methyltransferase [Clostridia bacterium]
MPVLYVVATPIGNLNDMSPRVRQTLESCDLIAAEDTRVTMKLTQVLGIHKPMISCHRHNEDGRKNEIVERMLAENLSVALTCDAGTPGISDPGEGLVAAAWEAGISVVPVSGPSAVVTALSVSGFDTREFAFYGFLPREGRDMDEKLRQIRARGISVVVLYESPHRARELLRHIDSVLPEAQVCVCCDLTKKFERIDRGPVASVLARLNENPNAEKGEYCIVMDLSQLPAEEKPSEETDVTPEQRLAMLLCGGMTLDEACAKLKEEGVRRNEIYRAKLKLISIAEEITR